MTHILSDRHNVRPQERNGSNVVGRSGETDNQSAPEQAPIKQPGVIMQFSKSVRVQLAVLLIIFSIPPFLLYSVFGAAEQEKQNLLLEAVRENGRTIARALTPFVQAMQPGDLSRIPKELERFESDQRSIKVLFKPAEGRTGFYYVASVPTIAAEDLAEDRQRLADLGIIAQLESSCSGDVALGNRVAPADEQHNVLLSITPIQSARGCWVIIVAAGEQAVAGLVDGRPYWMRPETRMAGIVYVTMAVLVFVVFATVWGALARFQRTAANVERGSSFAATTAVPEFVQMGRVFDAMVDRLRRTTELLRRAAEDNAHAFKGPLAVMRQASALLARKMPPEGDLGVAALKASLDRLEGLVLSAQHLDVATAELLNPRWLPMDLSEAVSVFVREYQLTLEIHSARLTAEIAPGVSINGHRETVETILENLVDNAVSFSPPDGLVQVRLVAEAGFAVLAVIDQGPGVDPRKRPHIFDRYYSSRPAQNSSADTPAEAHFGIGLWLVAQNVQALGGTVDVANMQGGGFAVTVNIPVI